MGASNDVTQDSNSDEMVGGDFHEECSVDTSVMGGGADGEPPAAAADGIINIGVDTGAGCDGHEAETSCWGAGSGDAEISLNREVVVAAPRAVLTRREGRLRRDVLTHREESPSPPAPDDARDGANSDAVGGAPTGGGAAGVASSSSPAKNGGTLGSTAGADGTDDASGTVVNPELVRLRAILEVREAELAQLKGVDQEFMRMRAILGVREAELAQLKGIDHRNGGAF